MLPYSKPKLVKYPELNKTWYVYFRYTRPDGKRQVIKKTEDINRIANFRLRTMAGEALSKALLDKLKEGWNPLAPDPELCEPEFMSIHEALLFALEKKTGHVERKTISGYRGTSNFVKKAIDELKLTYLSINDTKRFHIKSIMETAMKQRAWSNKAYNKHLGHLQAMLSELVQWDVLVDNPAHKIKMLKVGESVANIVPTLKQHKAIKQHLSTYYPDFHRFLMLLYHTGIRIEEMTKIKIGMIDYANRIITLPPAIVKNRRKERLVPLNDEMWEALSKLLEKCYPDDFYLFGSYRPSGEGNKGPNADFIPGPTKMKRDTVTKRWHKLVKIGLGINVNIYAYKHYGANMKILNGVSLDALKELYGHQSKLTTEIYAKAVKQVYRQQIINNSPSF